MSYTEDKLFEILMLVRYVVFSLSKVTTEPLHWCKKNDRKIVSK